MVEEEYEVLQKTQYICQVRADSYFRLCQKIQPCVQALPNIGNATRRLLNILTKLGLLRNHLISKRGTNSRLSQVLYSAGFLKTQSDRLIHRGDQQAKPFVHHEQNPPLTLKQKEQRNILKSQKESAYRFLTARNCNRVFRLWKATEDWRSQKQMAGLRILLKIFPLKTKK